MLQVTQAPQTPVLVGQPFAILGVASTAYAGKLLLLTIDGQFKTNGPAIGPSGAWQVQFLFQQTGNRRLTLSVEGESTEVVIAVVATLPEAKRLQFTQIPQRLQVQQVGVIAGTAENYAEESQLLLRADQRFELARPVVRSGKWQATIGFNQAGRRTIEIVGVGQDQASTEIEVVATQVRKPRVSFTNPPSQVKTETVVALGGGAENYADGAQLLLRADQNLELARPRVKDGKWQADTLFRQAGNRLIEILGSEQDVAQTVIAVQPPPTPDFQVIPRSAWTSTPTPSYLPELQPKRITLHHTATAGAPDATATQVQEAARMRAIWNIHVNGNGWADVGYHFIIMSSGRVFSARSERKVGAHDIINDGLGIAFDGTYTSTTINQQQFQSAVALCNLLCKRYGILDPVTPVPTPVDAESLGVSVRNLPRMCGHRDRVATECPGSEGGSTIRLPEIRLTVRQLLT